MLVQHTVGAFNVGGALRADNTVAADQAFLVDYAVHNGEQRSFSNFDPAESHTPAVKAVLYLLVLLTSPCSLLYH